MIHLIFIFYVIYVIYIYSKVSHEGVVDQNNMNSCPTSMHFIFCGVISSFIRRHITNIHPFDEPDIHINNPTWNLYRAVTKIPDHVVNVCMY